MLRFQWQIERALFSLRLGPGFTSTSPLKDTRGLKKKRQTELIKLKSKQGAACCFRNILMKR